MINSTNRDKKYTFSLKMKHQFIPYNCLTLRVQYPAKWPPKPGFFVQIQYGVLKTAIFCGFDCKYQKTNVVISSLDSHELRTQ